MIFRFLFCVLFSSLFVISCKKKESPEDQCPDSSSLLSSFTDNSGNNIKIYSNGEAWILNDETCSFVANYFDPLYIDKNYLITDSVVYIRTDGGELFKTRNTFLEHFETSNSFLDLLATSTADTGKFWTSFVLQSPLAPTVSDYVALRTCILNGTCDFLDNRIDLIEDPENAANHILQFTAVAPSANMVTSKCSFESALPYFPQDSDLWFEAKFNVRNNRPFSLVDFENNFFEESPGPRIVFRNNCLAVENKFGSKINYVQDNPIEFPIQSWVTVKIHLKFSSASNGLIQLWQNGNLIINKTGITLPLPNSIQNSLELGISATSNNSVLWIDDIRISDLEF
jgi:hypothetical protein